MKFVIYIFAIMLISSCDSRTKKTESKVEESVTSKAKKKDSLINRIIRGDFSEKIVDNGDPKSSSDLEIHYAYYGGNFELLPYERAVNDVIVEKVLIDKKDRYAKTGRIESEWFNESIEKLKKEYIETQKEIPEMNVWYLNQGITIDEQYENFVTVQFGDDAFMGGAHGSSYLSYTNIDKNTGKVLKLKDVVKDTKAFTKLAEKYFREGRVEKGQSLNDAGYWFEKGFYCPENFYFENDKMIFIFSQYEVAPYVMGMPTIEIPVKELESILLLSLERTKSK